MNQNCSDLEQAHNQLKTSLYQKFTQFTIFIFILTSLVELIRAIFLAKLSILVNPLISLCLAAFLYKYSEKHVLIITIFNVVTCTVSLYGHYSGTGYFNHSSDTFYFAFTYALLERLLADRVPTAKEKAFFSIANAIGRIFIVPLNDKGLFVIQCFVILSLTYFDFNQESHYKTLFRSYFQSKDQLGKFKDLVENYIPDEIIVVAQDSKQSLFVNRAFKSLFENTSTSDVKTQLTNFHLHVPMVNSGDSDSQTTSSSNLQSDTLLSLLDRQVSEAQRLSCKQSSYNLTFSKTNSALSNKKEEKIFEARILNIIWDEIPAFAIVLHDITQQQTILRLKIAADLNKDKVLATVSHELRTPLNAILGMIQIMYKKIQDKELLEYLKICKNSANLLIGLVNSILDLNQIRANKLKLCHDQVSLHELLNDIVHLFEFQCMQKGIALKLDVSPRVPKTLITDKNRLSQIFINLLGNALKFTIQGGITITAKDSEHPEMVQFSIQDTGMGIKEEDKHKLFMMYGRLDQDDEKINQQGVGLGLTISNNLACLLSGDTKLGGIKVESEYKKGSVFTFLVRRNLSATQTSAVLQNESVMLFENYQNVTESFFDEIEDIDKKINLYLTLPIKTVPKDFTSPPPNLSKKRVSPSGANFRALSPLKYRSEPMIQLVTPTILIVDDNPFNITVATHLVSCQGFKVKSALYGQTAIDIAVNTDYKREPIQLILMDCQMPIMDGYETAKVLKKLMRDWKIPEIPIVALTANNSVADREGCQNAGMCDYLTKPLTEVNLIKVLKKYPGKFQK